MCLDEYLILFTHWDTGSENFQRNLHEKRRKGFLLEWVLPP